MLDQVFERERVLDHQPDGVAAQGPWCGRLRGHHARPAKMIVPSRDTTKRHFMRVKYHRASHVAAERLSELALLQALRNRYDLDVEIEPDDAVAGDRGLVGTQVEGATGHGGLSVASSLDELARRSNALPRLS